MFAYRWALTISVTGRNGEHQQTGVRQYGSYGRADYGERHGQIVATLPVRAGQTNLWWQENGDTEIHMFSRRADGKWRMFPGPADGLGLTVVDTDYVDV